MADLHDELGNPIDPVETKGYANFECGNYLCACEPATWQGPDGRWVCEGCADEHNRRDFGKRKDGSPFYVKGDPSKAAKPPRLAGDGSCEFSYPVQADHLIC